MEQSKADRLVEYLMNGEVYLPTKDGFLTSAQLKALLLDQLGERLAEPAKPKAYTYRPVWKPFHHGGGQWFVVRETPGNTSMEVVLVFNPDYPTGQVIALLDKGAEAVEREVEIRRKALDNNTRRGTSFDSAKSSKYDAPRQSKPASPPPPPAKPQLPGIAGDMQNFINDALE